MSDSNALTVSIGVLGAVAVWLTGAVVLVPVWVVFIAWASFASVGGGPRGWARSVASNVVGIAIASVAVLVSELGGSGLLLTAVAVGVGSAAMVQASRLGLLVLPAIVWGFASTVGTVAVTGGEIASAPLSNPAAIAAVAMVLGGTFGLAGERLAMLMTSRGKSPKMSPTRKGELA